MGLEDDYISVSCSCGTLYPDVAGYTEWCSGREPNVCTTEYGCKWGCVTTGDMENHHIMSSLLEDDYISVSCSCGTLYPDVAGYTEWCSGREPNVCTTEYGCKWGCV